MRDLVLRAADHKTFPVWPPSWVGDSDELVGMATGEVGTLLRVTRLGYGLFLAIEYEGREYYGALQWDPPPEFKHVQELLLTHVGKPIRSIGDLDLSS